MGKSSISPIDMHSIFIDKSNRHILYAGGFEDLYKSADYGKNWGKVYSFQGQDICRILVDSDSSCIVYVIAGTDFFRSNDSGLSFTQYSIELNEAFDMTYDDQSKKLYVFGKYGVVESLNKGLNWKRIGNVMENMMVTCLIKDWAKNKLFAGTNNSGVYYLDEYNTKVVDLKKNVNKQYKLDHNYPNPFNATTVIQYSIEKDAEADFTIYNCAGQMVCTLVHGEKRLGSHSILWNGKNNSGIVAPSGIYIGILKIDGLYKESKKLILIK